MLQIHIDKAVKSIIPPIVITISTYGEKYAGYDLRQPAKINCEIFRSTSDRQYFSANVQHLRHHHCRPPDRHSGAGGRRRFGTVVFMLVLVSIGFTNGLTVIAAQRFGARDYRGLRRSVTTATVLSSVLR